MTRRKALPCLISLIWNSIKKIQATKQIADFAKIHHLLKNETTHEDLEECINAMIAEDFLTSTKIPKKDGFSYTIPDLTEKMNSIVFDTHDWYCFECHSPGVLANCSGCSRVYHQACVRYDLDKPTFIAGDDFNINNTIVSISGNSSVDVDATKFNYSGNGKAIDVKMEDDDGELNRYRYCTVCRLLKNDLTPEGVTKDELNSLLSFTYARVHSWIPRETFTPLASTSLSITKHGLEIFRKLFFKNCVSLDEIKRKIEKKQYKTVTEFSCDFLDLQHCIGILYGAYSSEYRATQYLIKDTLREISEICLCKDCYRHSNEQTDELWFAKACSVKHDLVFAKQIGYSFWPAKVLRTFEDQYEVRFFGARHPRAIIDKSSVKYVDNMDALKVKKTSGFNKAMQELNKHIELVAEKFPDTNNKSLDLSMTKKSKKIGKKGKTVTAKEKVTDAIDVPNDTIEQISEEFGKNTKNGTKSTVAPSNGITGSSSLAVNRVASVIETRTSAPAPTKKSRKRKFVETIDTTISKENPCDEHWAGQNPPPPVLENTVETSSIRKSTTDNVLRIDIEPTQSNITTKDNNSQDQQTIDSIEQEQVSSSTQNINVVTYPRIKGRLVNLYPNTSSERLRRQLEGLTNKEKVINFVCDAFDREEKNFEALMLDLKQRYDDIVKEKTQELRLQLGALTSTGAIIHAACETLDFKEKNFHKEILALRKCYEELLNTSKVTLCVVCQKEATLHCCSYNSYCSKICQSLHWYDMRHGVDCTRQSHSRNIAENNA